MDLLALFEGIPGQPKGALDALRKGDGAMSVASTQLEPHIAAMEANHHGPVDLLEVVGMLEFILSRSSQ